MPDSKHLRWVDDYSTDDESKPDITDGPVPSAEPAANDAVEPAANDSDGWQQYRQWISKAPAPRGRRVGIDPALYTWKGYRNWSEQVKRNWEPDAGDDSE
jgi:hypothetical protein